MWEYSDKVKEHYKNPKNVGFIENADAIGEAGALACGDKLKIYLKINDKGIIEDAKFQTFGCGSAVASSSILTEMIIGKNIDEVRKITNKDIADALDGLPPEKMHCSVMGHEALEDAFKNYFGDEGNKTQSEDKKIICNCFNVSKEDIIKAIVEKGAKTLDEIKEINYAGGGCARCVPNIKMLLDKYAKKDEKLNPVQFILKINKVLETNVAGELGKDSGGIELVNVEGKDVYVKLTGTCSSCKNATMTLKNFVEAQLREHVDPEINIIEVK